jgi:hypothetical protein
LRNCASAELHTGSDAVASEIVAANEANVGPIVNGIEPS